MLIDVHAHIDDEKYDSDREDVLRAIEDAGMIVINAGADIDSSAFSVDLAKSHPFIYACVGVHPHDAKDAPKDYLARLEDMAGEDKVVAIGEIGLDYHYDFSPRDVQKQVFKEQIYLAKKLGLPIVVNDREAHQDTLDIIRESGITGGLMHCYSGGMELAREYLGLGFFFSFGGVITFKNAKRAKEVAAQLPLDRVLLETDSPYMTPEPFRGKRNDPTKVLEVAKALGEHREVSIDEIISATADNARKLFKIRH